MNKNIKKTTSDLYADCLECPSNIFLNISFFRCPICFVIDNTESEEDEENGKN